MKHLFALAAVLVLAAHPIQAASPQVEAAIKALGKIESDAAKFQAFCRITKELAAVDGDDAKSEALDRQLDDLLRTLGRDVFMAFDLAGDLDPQSEDGIAFEAAISALEEKCGE